MYQAMEKTGCRIKSPVQFILRGMLSLGFLFALGVFSAQAQTSVTPGGGGTSGDPYRISELGNLVWMHNLGTASAYYKMTNDIDASGTAGWSDGGASAITTKLTGVFDGNGYTISGLTINLPAGENVGLFGEVRGTVKNLAILDANITGKKYVGILGGATWAGVISNCYVAGVVSSSAGGGIYIGGLAGWNSGNSVANCHADVDIVISGANVSYVGGLVGSVVESTLSDCYATGAIAITGGNAESVGGFVGAVATAVEATTITRCHASVDIADSLLGFYFGGFAGFICSDATVVSQCYATGKVTSPAVYPVGGFVGAATTSVISDCYSTGAISGKTLAMYGLWLDPYSVGGFIGNASGFANISNCYSIGKVNAKGDYAGGFAGCCDISGSTIYQSYWNKQTSGKSISAGGGTGKTTAQMKQQATFSGWDFTKVWGISASRNNGYPYLLNVATPESGPSITSFSINSDAENTTNAVVTLNNVCATDNAPTLYMASEDEDFTGASWLAYSTAPSFPLSSGNGLKMVYFKVKNASGESEVLCDSIILGSSAPLSFVAKGVKVISSHTETWNSKTQAVVSSDKYTFTAKLQLPDSFDLTTINTATQFEALAGGVYFSNTLGNATTQKFATPAKGGSAIFVRKEKNSAGKLVTTQTTSVSWTKAKLLTITIVGSPLPGSGEVVENTVNVSGSSIAAGTVSPTADTGVIFGSAFATGFDLPCPGKKVIKYTFDTDGNTIALESWAAAGSK